MPDKLSPFAKLLPFVSYDAAGESSFLNESDSVDITDTEETNLSWPPDASYDGPDSSVVGGAADSLEASKYECSSVGLS